MSFSARRGFLGAAAGTAGAGLAGSLMVSSSWPAQRRRPQRGGRAW
ncbi:MAG: hypothetical protein DPW14_06835 [Planctomycetes bacterium]|nr:hypothetical protein [Planctomycetota bacterium]